MIYLELFLVFLKIGLVSFGGGYGMIALIREEVLTRGWLSESDFLSFIAVSESTPGPLAINMATFIGSSYGGFLGAVVATLGVVLPSFIIILLIASILKNFLKYKGVKATLEAIRPTIIGLIIATALTMILSTVLGVESVEVIKGVDIKGIILFVLLGLITLIYYLIKKKTPSCILLIIIAGIFGILIYPL